MSSLSLISQSQSQILSLERILNCQANRFSFSMNKNKLGLSQLALCEERGGRADREEGVAKYQTPCLTTVEMFYPFALAAFLLLGCQWTTELKFWCQMLAAWSKLWQSASVLVATFHMFCIVPFCWWMNYASVAWTRCTHGGHCMMVGVDKASIDPP